MFHQCLLLLHHQTETHRKEGYQVLNIWLHQSQAQQSVVQEEHALGQIQLEPPLAYRLGSRLVPEHILFPKELLKARFTRLTEG